MNNYLTSLYMKSLRHLYNVPNPFCCSAAAGPGKDLLKPAIFRNKAFWILGNSQEISYCPLCGTRLPELQRKAISPEEVATSLEEWEVKDAPPISFIGAYLPSKVDDRKLLSVSRKTDPNAKGLPGGKVEPGETMLEALIREVEEETGLNVLEASPVFDAKDDTGIRGVTFYVTEYEGELSTREAGVVEWMTHSDFLRMCVFQEYNRALFHRLCL